MSTPEKSISQQTFAAIQQSTPKCWSVARPAGACAMVGRSSGHDVVQWLKTQMNGCVNGIVE